MPTSPHHPDALPSLEDDALADALADAHAYEDCWRRSGSTAACQSLGYLKVRAAGGDFDPESMSHLRAPCDWCESILIRCFAARCPSERVIDQARQPGGALYSTLRHHGLGGCQACRVGVPTKACGKR